MTSLSEDPCNLAAQLELEEESKKIPTNPLMIKVLEKMLLVVYTLLLPKPSEYKERNLLVKEFNKMAKYFLGNKNVSPTVVALGSFTMDLFTSKSDLDLSINFSDDTTMVTRDQKISFLKKFTRVLRYRQRTRTLTGISPIMRAKVPITKALDVQSGIEIDFSVENKDGILKSLFFKFVSSIDERFQKLSYLMKCWAKSHGINSSKHQTMNSSTIISLVAFHLQTRSPPILPPFSALLKDGNELSAIKKNAMEFKGFGKNNSESVAELLISLFAKLSSAEIFWQYGLCASTYEGLWIIKWKTGDVYMSVEDFVDRSENFARSVGKNGFIKIHSCIRETITHLTNFMMGQIDASELRSLLYISIDDSKEAKTPDDQHVRDEWAQENKRDSFDGGSAHNNPRDTESARQEPHATTVNDAQYNLQQLHLNVPEPQGLPDASLSRDPSAYPPFTSYRNRRWPENDSSYRHHRPRQEDEPSYRQRRWPENDSSHRHHRPRPEEDDPSYRQRRWQEYDSSYRHRRWSDVPGRRKGNSSNN